MCGYFTTYVDVKMKCKMLSLVSSETVNVHQPAKNLRFLLFILFFHIMRFDLRCMNLDKQSIMWRSFWPLLSHQQHRVENAFVLYRHQWSTQRPVVNLNDDSSVMTDCWKAIKRNTKWFFFCLHLKKKKNTDFFISLGFTGRILPYVVLINNFQSTWFKTQNSEVHSLGAILGTSVSSHLFLI